MRANDLLVEELRTFLIFASMRSLAELRAAWWIDDPGR